MKLSFVSTRSISDAMRYQMLRMQSDLAKADKELSTGRLADVGVVLGVRTSQSVSLARDLDIVAGSLLEAGYMLEVRMRTVNIDAPATTPQLRSVRE